MPRKPIVGGNWKSNPKSWSEASALLDQFAAQADSKLNKDQVDVVLFPISMHAGNVKNQLKEKGLEDKIYAGVQNCSKENEGAFTGEVTCGQISDLGFQWVLIGHSERRHKYNESNADLTAKLEKAQAAGLNIIFCIGELLEERNAGKTNDVVKEQILAFCDKVTNWDKLVIAYEPVWAIGTGVVATTEQAQEAHVACRKVLAEAVSQEVADKVRIQYGGSVTADNCGELMGMADIDGFLVGGASLKPGFMDIVATAGK